MSAPAHRLDAIAVVAPGLCFRPGVIGVRGGGGPVLGARHATTPPEELTAMPELTARASVPTETPGRYIGQLCKHFAHRIPAESDAPGSGATRGRIEFPDAGVCTLRAEAASLEMELTAKDRETLERLEDVVTRHLARFAWREPPTVTWR